MCPSRYLDLGGHGCRCLQEGFLPGLDNKERACPGGKKSLQSGAGAARQPGYHTLPWEGYQRHAHYRQGRDGAQEWGFGPAAGKAPATRATYTKFLKVLLIFSACCSAWEGSRAITASGSAQD